MADEIDLNIGSFDLDSANNIAIEDISLSIAKSVQEFALPKHHGSVIPVGRRRSMMVRLRGTINGTNYDNLRSKLDSLKAAFESTSEQSLTLDDDRFMKVQYREFTLRYITLRTLAEFSVGLIASDPFWYAASLSSNDQNTYSGSYTINNAGNAATRAKVTISRAGGSIADSCKLENQTTGEIFQYRGTVLATESLIVNNRVDAVDVSVTNDGDDDIKNFEGDFITLNPGNNTFVFTGAAGVRIQTSFRAAYY